MPREVRYLRGVLDPAQEAQADAAMERYAQGDDAAFADLYRLLGPELDRFAMGLTRHRARAEDLVQQTFLQLHRARGRFRAGSHVAPWALVIARRLVLDDLRRLRREGPLPEHDRADHETPEDLAAARELRATAVQALDRLPAAQRQAYELVREEGLSVVEAAAAAGTSVGALKVRAFRAYEALRAALRGGT